MTGEKVIYSIGHSSRSIDQFLQLLQIYQIDAVADVRRFPTSKKYPHFEQQAIQQSLQQLKIDYNWLGETLGGFRKGGYERYMETDSFLLGIDRLLDLANSQRAAMMCAEQLFFRCHRRFIANHLLCIGWNVIHILDNKRTYPHKPLDTMPLDLRK